MSSRSGLLIREFRSGDDGALRRCVIELQDHERDLEPRLPPGRDIADRYLGGIQDRCAASGGRIFVAELASAVVGFVAVTGALPSAEIDEPTGTRAVITDLAVLRDHRRHGVGSRLLARAERFAREAGAAELRVEVLTRNAHARRLYLAADFTPYVETLVKRL